MAHLACFMFGIFKKTDYLCTHNEPLRWLKDITLALQLTNYHNKIALGLTKQLTMGVVYLRTA